MHPRALVGDDELATRPTETPDEAAVETHPPRVKCLDEEGVADGAVLTSLPD